MVSAPVKRLQVALAVEYGLSQRRACALVGISRSGLQYQPQLPQKDAQALVLIRTIAGEHPDYGYRRVHAEYCERHGKINLKRVARLWRQAGLQLQPRKRRRRRYGEPRNQEEVDSKGHVWSCDFMEDRVQNGTKLRIFTIVDEFTRECHAVRVRPSFKSQDVIAVLGELFKQHGSPVYLKSDNGPEFIAKALRAWIAQQGSQCSYIEPGKPWQNGRIERFNGTLRRECLNKEWFLSPWDARAVVEKYRLYYNEKRRHSSLGYRTPLEFAELHDQQREGQEKAGLSKPVALRIGA